MTESTKTTTRSGLSELLPTSYSTAREKTMNDRIAHWKKVNSVSAPVPVQATLSPKKQKAVGDMELPPVQAIDSDESWCSDDSAPFPLPVEQLDKYPVEQRKQQKEANRFYNFFERYALEVTEAGVGVGSACAGAGGGLCSGSGTAGVNDDNNTATDVNESMRNVSIFDDSSVCGEEAVNLTDGTDVTGNTTTTGTGTTRVKKGVHWNPNVMSCNAADYGDFYDRYMLVVTEVGASCGAQETTSSTATGEGDQAGARSSPAVALDKKTSPTSTTETDQVDADNKKESKQDPEDQGWSPNQVNCMDMDMKPCVGMAMAVPINLNKFWESLVKNNNADENNDNQVQGKNTRRGAKGNPKRMKPRESSSSALSKEVRYIRYCLLLHVMLPWIIHHHLVRHWQRVKGSKSQFYLLKPPFTLFLFLRQIDEDEEPDLDLDVARDTSVVNLDDVNVMMDSMIDTVLSNELKGMATEFMGKVRSFVGEDGCPVADAETETVTSDNLQ
jgi:hypothetical protein